MNRDPNEIICHCEEITYQEILDAIKAGAKSVVEITDLTDAGIACGTCIETLEEILEEEI